MACPEGLEKPLAVGSLHRLQVIKMSTSDMGAALRQHWALRECDEMQILGTKRGHHLTGSSLGCCLLKGMWRVLDPTDQQLQQQHNTAPGSAADLDTNDLAGPV